MTADETGRHLAALRCYLADHGHPDDESCEPSRKQAKTEAELLRLRGLRLADMAEGSLEDRLEGCLADLRKTSEGGKNPQLALAAGDVESAAAWVRVWALGIVL